MKCNSMSKDAAIKNANLLNGSAECYLMSNFNAIRHDLDTHRLESGIPFWCDCQFMKFKINDKIKS